MIEILLTACTLLGQCQTVKLPIDPTLPRTPYVCGFYGQLATKDWMDRHPGYYPKRLRCGPAGENI